MSAHGRLPVYTRTRLTGPSSAVFLQHQAAWSAWRLFPGGALSSGLRGAFGLGDWSANTCSEPEVASEPERSPQRAGPWSVYHGWLSRWWCP